MKVEELHDAQAWLEFNRVNNGTIYQSFEWGEFRGSDGSAALPLAVRDGDGTLRLMAMVLRRSIGFGFCYYYCPAGPIVKGKWSDPLNLEALSLLNRQLRKRARRDRAVFLKIDPYATAPALPQHWLREFGFKESPLELNSRHVAHVDISCPEADVFAAFKKDARYSIRYAERQGVQVISGRGPHELALFKKLYHATSESKGFASRDAEYLRGLQGQLMEQNDLARVYVALHHGEPIAASIVTFYGREAVYMYAGSNAANQTLYGTYLLQWEAIKEAKRRGCTVYDMTGVAGTSDPEDPWAGLRRFKLKFGSEIKHWIGAYDAPYSRTLYALVTGTAWAKARLKGSVVQK